MTTSQVWGTFSVRDHCRPEAFLREVLLFDKLLIPYPSPAEPLNPADPSEWMRWKRPNKANPRETWNPGRLDQLLKILGAEVTPDSPATAGLPEIPGYNGARLVHRVLWSQRMWWDIKSRPENALVVNSGDPFHATAVGIGTSGVVPKVVEAVAAYPAEGAWRTDARPHSQPPAQLAAQDALVQLARPLLIPPSGSRHLDNLRRAVDLGQSPEYQQMRGAYYDWFRGFIQPLRSGSVADAEIRVDAASLMLALNQLRDLWKLEQDVVRKLTKRKLWDRVEVGCMALGTTGTVGLALTQALPAIGVPAAMIAFAGWGIGRWNKADPARPLNGASMFVEAERRLGFASPP